MTRPRAARRAQQRRWNYPPSHCLKHPGEGGAFVCGQAGNQLRQQRQGRRRESAESAPDFAPPVCAVCGFSAQIAG
jgi:hypothetical protein